MKKRTFALILSLTILLSAAVPALAASEQDIAVAYLMEHGVYQGDQNGNLNLDSGLTRAELAAILTRLEFMNAPEEWSMWGEARFSDPANRYNTFTDIPAWALPYVEYCYQRGFMKGVTKTSFDPQGKVNPQMACTVMLRYCGIAETDWNYNTSVEKAQAMGLAPDEGVSGSTIRRDTVAIIIYRGIKYEDAGVALTQPTEPAPAQTEMQDAPQAPEKQTPAMSIEEMKAEIIRLTNEERVKAGVPELEVLPELMDCAQAKADDFMINHYFDHTSPVYGTAGEMIKAAVPKAKSYGENLATWTNTPQGAIDGWMSTPDHRANMLATKFTHLGIGIAEGTNGGYAWVLQFVKL